MKATMKPLAILFALTLLLAGCGGSSSGTPAVQTPDSLDAGGSGLPLTDTVNDQGETVTVNFSNAVDVNDLNQVIGFAEITEGAPFSAALWSVDTNGEITLTPQALAPIAGNTFSAAFAIDESGIAVGQSADGDKLVAVLWEAGSSTPAPLPALTETGNSKALAISADGTLIVGEAQDATLRTRGVIWVADAEGNFTTAPAVLPFTAFAVAGDASRYSSASGVVRIGANEILAVGEAEAGDRSLRAAFWRSTNNGATFNAGSLGTDYVAYAVNGNRQVVGDNDIDLSPVLWTISDQGVAGAPVPLADAGSAVAINENYRIAGSTGVNPSAAVWGNDGPLSIGNPPSEAYGLNNDSQPLVVGREGNQGFIKRAN